MQNVDVRDRQALLCSTREPTDCQRANVSNFMVATLGAEGKKTGMCVA
jgi:hypothetical protein